MAKRVLVVDDEPNIVMYAGRHHIPTVMSAMGQRTKPLARKFLV
jgi:hypothetical protein